jgi:hypothetical protein
MDRIYGRVRSARAAGAAPCCGNSNRPVLEGIANAASDKKVVLLSTNKAFQQISPYKYSKAFA